MPTVLALHVPLHRLQIVHCRPRRYPRYLHMCLHYGKDLRVDRAMTTKPRTTCEPKWTKRRRRITLITVIDYLSNTDKPATCLQLLYVLKQRNIDVDRRTLQRWLKQWAQDNAYTTIRVVDSKPGQPHTYTVDKCESNRSYKRIIRLVDWYMGG